MANDEDELDESGDDGDGDGPERSNEVEGPAEADPSPPRVATVTADRHSTDVVRAGRNGSSATYANGHELLEVESSPPRKGGKPKAPPIASARLERDHPLFPQTPDAPLRGDIVWIHISRLDPETGNVKHHPRRFAAGELLTWEEVYEMCGGGDYRLIATNAQNQYSAYFPAKPSDFYTLDGPSRPFQKGETVLSRPGVHYTSGEVARARASGPVTAADVAKIVADALAAQKVAEATPPLTAQDVAKIVAEGVKAAAPAPPQGPTTAEIIKGIADAFSPVVQALVGRPALDTITPMLKMMEISSNERIAAIKSSEARQPDNSQIEILKLMVSMRDKPMGMVELATAMKALKGDDKPMTPMDMVNLMKAMNGDKGSGLQQVAETMKLVDQIRPPSATGPTELGEITQLIGTFATAAEKLKGDGKDEEKQGGRPPQTTLVVPGMGVITNPSPALVRRLEAAAAGAVVGGAAPSAVPAVAAPVGPPVVPTPVSVPATPQIAAAAPVAVPAPATPPVVTTPPSPSAEEQQLGAALSAALAEDPALADAVASTAPVQTNAPPSPAAEAPPAPPPAAAAPAALTPEEVAYRIQNDPAFAGEVQQRLKAQKAPPTPEPPAPPVAELRADPRVGGAIPLGPSTLEAVANGDVEITPEMLQTVAKMAPSDLEAAFAPALGADKAKGLADALANLPEAARPLLLKSFPPDGLRALLRGAIVAPKA